MCKYTCTNTYTYTHMVVCARFNGLDGEQGVIAESDQGFAWWACVRVLEKGGNSFLNHIKFFIGNGTHVHFGLIIVWEFSSQRPFLDFFRLAVDTKTSISSYLVNLDDRSIWNWNPKLINHFSNGKLSLRISNFLSSQGEDQLAWRCYKHGTFEVHSYYDTLRWFTGAQFPL